MGCHMPTSPPPLVACDTNRVLHTNQNHMLLLKLTEVQVIDLQNDFELQVSQYE